MKEICDWLHSAHCSPWAPPRRWLSQPRYATPLLRVRRALRPQISAPRATPTSARRVVALACRFPVPWSETVVGHPSIAGTGTANLFLTFDDGAATVSAAGNCTPFFGVAELTTTRAGKPSSETLNLNGVSCAPITTANSPILGGFGISKAPTPVNGGKGYGKVSGFLDPSGSVSLTLHGSITE